MQSFLDFLSTTDVGRRVPVAAEENGISRSGGKETRRGGKRLGAGNEERPLILPTPSFVASAERKKHVGAGVPLFFVLSFVRDSLVRRIFLGQA